MSFSVVSAKSQVTFPMDVRKALGLKPGDLVSWGLEGDSVRLRFVSLIDQTFAQVLQARLSVLTSDANETAFRTCEDWPALNQVLSKAIDVSQA